MRDENEIETEMYIIVCDQMSYLFIALYDKNQWFFRLFFFFFFLWCLCVVFVVLTLNVPVPVPVCVCFGVVSLCRRSNPLYINWFSFSVFFINITLCACVCVYVPLCLSVSIWMDQCLFNFDHLLFDCLASPISFHRSVYFIRSSLHNSKQTTTSHHQFILLEFSS